MATILVVEDDAATAAFLALALHDAEYAVVTAAHGQAALAHLVTLRPALILIEGEMLVLDGLRLCQQLAADPQYHAIPRVLMSIWRHDPAAYPCVTAWLPKPFTQAALLATIHRCLPRSATTPR